MQHLVWNVDPDIFRFGAIQLRWYGVLFVGSFFVGLAFMNWVYKREHKDPKNLDTFMMYMIIGAVIGARLMHCFAYEPAYFIAHPLEILYVWKGGLASHGGLIGSIIAIYIFSKRYKEDFAWLLSRTAMAGMFPAAFVRIGNFFNSEILGLPTDKPWGVIFARVDNIPRHPVQLYEAFSYLLIFVILVYIYRHITQQFATRVLPGIFAFLLFSARFFLEYFKTEQADYSPAIPFTVGQLLSVPLVLLGVLWIVWAFIKTPSGKRWQPSR